MRRLPLAAALVAGVLALTGCAGLSMSGGSTSSPSAPYTSPTLKVAKPAPWTAPLTIAPSTGTFTSVMVTDTATRYQLMGSIVNNGASWTSESRPAAGGTHPSRFRPNARHPLPFPQLAAQPAKFVGEHIIHHPTRQTKARTRQNSGAVIAPAGMERRGDRSARTGGEKLFVQAQFPQHR